MINQIYFKKWDDKVDYSIILDVRIRYWNICSKNGFFLKSLNDYGGKYCCLLNKMAGNIDPMEGNIIESVHYNENDISLFAIIQTLSVVISLNCC